MERTKRYPECFPGNFETEILPKGAKEESRPVYRCITLRKQEELDWNEKSSHTESEAFLMIYPV